MRIRIDLEPVAKARARTVVRNGKVWSFTPTATKDAEDYIRLAVKQAGRIPVSPHIPLKLTVTFYRQKSMSIPKDEDKPVRKPDLSNLCKTIEDALCPDFIPDDAQITKLVASKEWSKTGKGYIEFDLEVDKDATPLSQV